MKKAVCLIMAITLMLVLISCMKEADSMTFFSDRDNDLADARMEQVFDAIKAQDKEALKALFSERAIAETEDIDAGVNYLFSLVQGEAVSWTRDGSAVVTDTTECGHKSKELTIWYFLNTSEQNYWIFLVDYPIDTIAPENAGLYSLRIIKEEEVNELIGTVQDWTIPGIYIPDNENE